MFLWISHRYLSQEIIKVAREGKKKRGLPKMHAATSQKTSENSTEQKNLPVAAAIAAILTRKTKPPSQTGRVSIQSEISKVNSRHSRFPNREPCRTGDNLQEHNQDWRRNI